jgi:hypothetical protein
MKPEDAKVGVRVHLRSGSGGGTITEQLVRVEWDESDPGIYSPGKLEPNNQAEVPAMRNLHMPYLSVNFDGMSHSRFREGAQAIKAEEKARKDRS